MTKHPEGLNGASADGAARNGHSPSPIGLALAGGGPEGIIYEISALRALDEALDGIDFNRIPIYVGVSAGTVVASFLANGLTTEQMCRAVVKTEPGEHPFAPEVFLRPAFGEITNRLLSVPGRILGAVWDMFGNGLRLDTALLGRLSGALPAGVVDNRPVRKFLENTFSIHGRTDDFRELESQLFVVATDLESAQPVLFGAAGYDDVPISQAVQASTALPGLYPPVEINGRYYVDGVLLKTVHASVALEYGAKLLIGVNPIVPIDADKAARVGSLRSGDLVRGGLPTIMSQTFRTLVHSRMKVGWASYKERYPAADVVLFEPPRDDYEMFFTNVFSFAEREKVMEHAYRSTRRMLRMRRAELEPIFARHGIRFRNDVLADTDRSVWASCGLEEYITSSPKRLSGRAVTHQLDRSLNELRLAIEEIERSGV